MLGHSITGEVVQLGTLVGEGGWEVDDNGEQAYVADDEQTMWCQALFEWAAYSAPAGMEEDTMLMSSSSGARLRLHEWRQEFQACSMTLQKPHGSVAEVKTFCFTRSFGGSHLWVSLPSLYDSFGFEAKGSAQKWYNRHWLSWARQLAEAQVDPHVALRKALPWTGGPHTGSESRCLEVATVSMHGLVALLQRWVCLPERRGGLLVDKPHAAALLQAVMPLLQGEWQHKIFADIGCRRLPPAGVSGRRPVLIKFDRLTMDARPLVETLQDGPHDSVATLLADTGGGMVPILDIMYCLAGSIGDMARSLSLQLAWCVASRLESQLVGSMRAASGASAEPLARRSRFDDDVGGRRRRVVAYTLGSQQQFGDSGLLYLSAAFDMSPVGGRRAGYGLVANTENMAMLTAPQASGSVSTQNPQTWLRRSRPAHPIFEFTKPLFPYSKLFPCCLVNTLAPGQKCGAFVDFGPLRSLVNSFLCGLLNPFWVFRNERCLRVSKKLCFCRSCLGF